MQRATNRAVNGHDNDPWLGTAMNEVADLQLIVKSVNLVNINMQIKNTMQRLSSRYSKSC